MEPLSILGHSQPPQNKPEGRSFKRLKSSLIRITRILGLVGYLGNDSLRSLYNMEQNERTPEEKVKFVEQELLAVLQGKQTMMACPYCYKLNIKPEGEVEEPLCCRLFAMAAIAAMAGQEMQEATDRVARLMDAVHG